MGTELHILLVLVCLLTRATAQYYLEGLNETSMTRPGCPYRCEGGSKVEIPYPFGIGASCSRDETFMVTCNHSFSPPKPFLNSAGVEVLSVSVEDASVNVENPLMKPIIQNLPRSSSAIPDTYDVTTTLYWTTNGTCVKTGEMEAAIGTSTTCSNNSYCDLTGQGVDQIRCHCSQGYQGNPYLPNGCQDINECLTLEMCSGGCKNTDGSFICNTNKKAKAAIIGVGSGVGTIIMLLCLWLVYKMIKRRNKIKLKGKFFKRNGGLLLQKQLNSGEEGNVDKSKLFTAKELEMATDRFNKNRILGQGGQGTVYKGMLADGKIVAIKVSSIVDERNIEQFINEVVILSQINHRNVVKLHGCCLETEVPHLVYEFIPNGTLFDYIHNKKEDSPLSWNVRLQIAIDVASALTYLHLATSFPIYHRDIKTTNILLDEKYNAKVADFGTSRSISIDQTHLTTRVSGTFGYMDPEYFQSSQFTEKSDVYSFGVVLLELLTSEKPLSSTRTEELRSLTTYFMFSLKEQRLFDILDAQVQKDGIKEEITRVANLAKRCLNLSGSKRPTMREVAVELEMIKNTNGAISTIMEEDEDVDYDIIDIVENSPPFDTV